MMSLEMLVQASVTLILALAVVTLLAAGVTVPDWLAGAFLVAVGVWFPSPRGGDGVTTR